MAQRIAPLSTPNRSSWSPAYRRRLATLVDRERARFRADPRLFLWQAGWSPIWLGSNGPAPRPGQWRGASSRSALAANDPGAGRFIQSHLDRLASRLSRSLLAGSILRGLWLALLLVSAWALLATIGFVGLPPVLAMVALAGFGAIAGGIYGLLHPIDPSTVAVMLDRTFGLDERLTTANGQTTGEYGTGAKGAMLPRLQLADAANSLGEVMHELPRAVFIPVREVIALLVVSMALLTALFAYVPDQPVPNLSDAPVPRFVPASERLADPAANEQPLTNTPEQAAPSASEVREQAQAAQQAREDLGVLGEALQDHPITQAASDAIAAGDYGAASEMIRSAASQAPSASQEEREALADDLDAAADQVAPTSPDLADSSREAADDLRLGGTEAEEGLEGLADTVDQTAAAVAPKDQTEQGPEVGEQGAAGGAQPGASSQESGAGGNAQQEQGPGANQESSSSSSQPQQPAGDPGEGVAAEPGVANEEMQGAEGGDEAGEMSGASSAGQSQSGAGGAPDPEATDGGSGSDQAEQQPSSGEGASSEGGDPASEAGSQGLIGAPEDETSASQGSGAGTGQSGANDQTTGDQDVGDPAPPGGGEAVDPPAVGEVGDPPPGNGGGEGAAGNIGDVGGANDLSLQGTSDQGVRTGGTSGSSSSGSGAGSGAASGDQVQQQVGVAGPDANRIPDGMQDIIEDFFTESGTGP